MEDQLLWKRIQMSDKNALKKLHAKYFHQMLLHASKQLSGDNGLAEELVSDCFIKLWENRKTILIRSSVRNYLFIMIHHNIIDHFRKKKQIWEPLNQNIHVVPYEEDFDELEQNVRIYQAVKKLPDQCRKILELAVYEDMTYSEIADKLSISKNTVKTQIGRAYRKLKETLDPKEFLLFLLIH